MGEQIKIGVSFSEKTGLFHVCIGDTTQQLDFPAFHSFWYRMKSQADRAWAKYDREQRNPFKKSRKNQ